MAIMNIAGYHELTLIHQSDRTLVFRGKSLKTRESVILKTLAKAYPAPEETQTLRHEYELTRSWSMDGLTRALDLIESDDRPVLILHDIGGDSLHNLYTSAKRPMPLETFWEIAIRLVQALGNIHQQQIIHKDIKPSNLIFNPQTGVVAIIDFGIADQIASEVESLRVEQFEGTLAYIAPEQTGRMNRMVDWRVDFYSLGISFYELLSGALPFPVTDTMELVHCHIARTPTPLAQLRPELPQMLCEIIARMMAKTPDSRYQSAFGIQADLEQCRNFWNQQHTIPLFTLGLQDVSGKFQIPANLYGRLEELEQLRNAFEQALTGNTVLVQVKGHSGVGKTAIIRELIPLVNQNQGYFISGKFEQFQANIPYFSILQAVRQLVRHLLTESAETLDFWKKCLTEELEENLSVLGDLIPEWSLITGEQAQSYELSGTSAQNRFNQTFLKFLRVFTRNNKFLVLYLDDLQWADWATLKLLKFIMTAPDLNRFLFITAYRDNEMAEGHPSFLTLLELEQAGVSTHHIPLRPLRVEHIQALLRDTLHNPEDQLYSLAQLICQKTQGNPFFVRQFFQTLHKEKLIQFSGYSRQWEWDLRRIESQNITDNVVHLMSDQLRRLTPPTLKLLEWAACLGNRFDTRTLSALSENDWVEISANLWDALWDEFILPVSEHELRNAEGFQSGSANTLYRFAHDRVRQAVYENIEPSLKFQLHRKIGEYLLKMMERDEHEEFLFDAVNHLNLGLSETSGTENPQMAELNSRAARRAMKAVAFEPAMRYFQASIAWLGASPWENHYALCLALHNDNTQAAYLSGDLSEAQRLVNLIQQKARTFEDQLDACNSQILLMLPRNKGHEALDLAIDILQKLGVSIPRHPGKWHLLTGLMNTWLLLNRKTPEELMTLPLMTEVNKFNAIKILVNIAPMVLFYKPEMIPVMMFAQLKLSVTYGNTQWSPFAFVSYGVVLCGGLGQIERGHEFARLGLDLLEKLGVSDQECRVLNVIHFYIHHWTRPLQQLVPLLLEDYQKGLKSGDLEYAGYAVNNYCIISFFSGKPLDLVQTEIEKYSKILKHLDRELFSVYLSFFAQLMADLQDVADHTVMAPRRLFNEEHWLPHFLEKQDASFLFNIYLCKMISCYYHGRIELAVEYADAAQPYRDSAISSPMIPVFLFFRTLAWIKLAGTTDVSVSSLLRKAKKDIRQMRRWANSSVHNYAHKLYLMEAEYQRVSGNSTKAMGLYQQAIDLARQHAFPQDEALAHELAGSFFEGFQQNLSADAHFRAAHYAYNRWGAHALVHRLNQRHLKLSEDVLRTGSVDEHQTTAHNQTSRTFSQQIDLAAVLQASQTISSEIVLENLLNKLMNLMLKNAGAQSGVLILLENETWKIVGQWHSEQEHQTSQTPQPLESMSAEGTTLLPLSLIHYVMRTRENLVLGNAVNSPDFYNDPYILQYQPKSLLCTPIQNQNQIIGMVYMENNLAEEAFTRERLVILKALASQAAISIVNARLYENLKTTERLKHELETARSVQELLIPASDPQVEGLELASFYQSASESGGDWYGYRYYEAHGVLDILIGDVTGHGVPSALITAMAGSFYKTLDVCMDDQVENDLFLRQENALAWLNEVLYSTTKGQYAMTFFYASLDLRKYQLTYTSAGHNPPLIWHDNTVKNTVATAKEGIHSLNSRSVPLGYKAQNRYTSQVRNLRKGDVLLFYTDGLLENYNSQGEMFGIRRLKNVLKNTMGCSATEIKDRVLKTACQHYSDQAWDDDTTFIVARLV
ncbi:MAG: AAA family ATPase [SAR324 cluster bacterium]|nr:AAA family ATPase [SAR324 cluster bacterium]